MPDLSGRTFGQYTLLEQIGAGGMATIYTARQPGLDRIVAVKVLPEYLLNQPGFIDRFKIEAQAVARLDHPHILSVYDYGQAEGVPYLVMKYVPDGTLKDLMAGAIDPPRAVEIIRQIAEALDHAHWQDVIHRDVKPSNVLMQGGKWALLTDFGLAKVLTSTSQLTASGASVGTPDYMSPEQAQGNPVNALSDIYSLGVIAYQLLTGDVPFHAETPTGVMLKHVLEPPPSPCTVNPKLGAATEDAILRAMAKSPADRFPTAVEFAEALEQSLDPNATRAPTVAPTLPAARSIALRLPVAIGLGVLAVIMVVIAALILINPSASTSPSGGQLGAVLYDDFSGSSIDATRWTYAGTYTATLNSPAVSVQNGRLSFEAANPTEDYYDGGVRVDLDRPFSLVSTRVTLLDATGFSDVGFQVNGAVDAPDEWAYISLAPSDASAYGYLGNEAGTQETFLLLPGTGMPATHELAIRFDGSQLTFYVDGQPRKSVAAKQVGHYLWLQFNVDPNGRVSGTFDDVRITYADQ